MSALPLSPEDRSLLIGAREDWETLAGARILLTGGTGFVGKWLVAAFVAAEREYCLRAQLFILSREPQVFATSFPDLAGADCVQLVRGDVRSGFECAACTHIVHGATPSDQRINAEHPLEMISVIEDGTRALLARARRDAVERFLLVSSGAVYRPPAPAGGYPEGHEFGADWPIESSPYHGGKRRAEQLTWAAAGDGLPVTVARLFSFVGPYLPLDRHFAIGNFIGDALQGRPVLVRSDGSPVRSYLYAADMAAWMWKILVHPRATGRAFNVGSEQPVSIAEVAAMVGSTVEPPVPVSFAVGAPATGADVYLPDMRRTYGELGLRRRIGLREAIRRTVAWQTVQTEPGFRSGT